MKSIMIIPDSERISFRITGSLKDLFKIRDFLKGTNLSLDVSDPFIEDPGSSYHLLKIECPEVIKKEVRNLIADFIKE